MKVQIVSILILLFCLNAKAQEVFTIKGKLQSAKSAEAIPYGAVLLVKNQDSLKKLGAISVDNGSFIFDAVEKGSYKMQVNVLGYEPFIKEVVVDAKSVDLGVLKLDQLPISLEEVKIEGRLATATIKGDTVEFNADAYKTKPNAAVEEMLKKIPGVEIDKEGNILMQGQKVNRLTVDGKDFFGTDPKTATKNLPADAIAKIQIIDSKTLEAKATGIDDGQREKVLNLTIKEDKKNGWFGNASAASGTTDKYNGYLSANHFNKRLQFAVLGMSNNISNSSFGWEDLQSFSSGNVSNLFAPPAGGSFTINVNNGKANLIGSGVFDNSAIGAVTTHSGGVNFSNAWGKNDKLAISSSYFTYFSAGLGTRLSNTQDLTSLDVLRTAENSIRNSDNQSHRFNFKLEYHPDSLIDIIFRPTVILNKIVNSNNRIFNSNYDVGGKANDGSQNLNQQTNTPALFGELSVLKRLKNNKGSVSLRLNGTQNTYNANYYNRSLFNEYTSGNRLVNDINQFSQQANVSKSYTINTNYMRPVFNKNWNANAAYIYNQSLINALQETFDYNAITNSYQTIVPDFSNNFKSKTWMHAARFGLIYNKDSWNYNFGFAAQQTGLEAESYSIVKQIIGNISKDYYSFLPRFSVNYKNKNNQTVQINYNASINLPSVTDLQPVQNNTNPLNQRIGNPDLEPRKNHRISLNYNTFTPENNRYWNGYFLYNLAFNDVSNSVNTKDGVQFVKPINVDGNYYINTGTNIGMPAKLKGMRYGFGMSIYMEHRTGFINEVKNATDRYNFGPSANLTYDIDDKLNAGIYSYVGYNLVNNSAIATVDNKYFNLSNSVTLSYEFLKNIRLDATVEHRGNAGRATGYNINSFLLNAGLEKYLLDRKFTLSLKGFDLLKQNTSIGRNVNNTRIEDYQFNNITRYFYLGLNYKLSKVGAKTERSVNRSTVN